MTKGKLEQTRIDVPTFRAVAPGYNGDRAAMQVVVHGASTEQRALASGQERRQLGLKLRAEDGCNLVYVMWRLDPKPMVEVSIKRNPGQRTSAECGARGYTKVKPVRSDTPPALDDGSAHELRAEISDDKLVAWIDGRVVWDGVLPDAACELTGPVGIRSDNLAFDLVRFSADAHHGVEVAAKCIDQHSD